MLLGTFSAQFPGLFFGTLSDAFLNDAWPLAACEEEDEEEEEEEEEGEVCFVYVFIDLDVASDGED